ncbi:hypothetical protein RCO48_36380 [Peribacillus frigoritolerans]|nr:hypothetical protein [Peribacillus frigoritolerans]
MEKLKPIFKGGTVTAGNASGVNDGASALLLMSAEKSTGAWIKTSGQICCRRGSGLRTVHYGPWSNSCYKKKHWRGQI